MSSWVCKFQNLSVKGLDVWTDQVQWNLPIALEWSSTKALCQPNAERTRPQAPTDSGSRNLVFSDPRIIRILCWYVVLDCSCSSDWLTMLTGCFRLEPVWPREAPNDADGCNTSRHQSCVFFEYGSPKMGYMVYQYTPNSRLHTRNACKPICLKAFK